MLIYEGNLHKKKLERYLNQGPRKSHFPINVVDGHTDKRTDILIYRVASQLKILKHCIVKTYMKFKEVLLNIKGENEKDRSLSVGR